MNLITAKAGLNDLADVRQNQVYIADFDMFTQPSVGTLVEGIEALACMFYPEIFIANDHISKKFVNLRHEVSVHQSV